MAAGGHEEQEGFDFQFVPPLKEDFMCPICHLALRDPVLTICGHRYCRDCLDKYHRSSGRRNCPMDNEELKREDIFPDKATKREILSSTVLCPNTGCKWVGELSKVDEHEQTCDGVDDGDDDDNDDENCWPHLGKAENHEGWDKIAQGDDGNPKGYGFVHFETQESADRAIAKVNGRLLNDKKVYVGKAKPFTNVFVKNLGKDITDEEFEKLCRQFGKIVSFVLKKDDYSNRSKGFGFVSYETPEQAEEAVNKLCQTKFKGRKLYAGEAQNKTERQAALRHEFEKREIERMNPYQGVNLYVKNLDDSVDDARLHQEFSTFGTITSAKVMTDEIGNSKGFGFVCFSSSEEATKAVTEMNGMILERKPLYVALAQRKDERRAHLAAQHMQRISGMRMHQAEGQQVGQMFPQARGFYMQAVPQGQRPFYAPQFQQVRPRWQSNPQQQQQMRASHMPVMPGAAQVPRARGVRQLAPRGMAVGPQQVQAGGAPAQRMAAMFFQKFKEPFTRESCTHVEETKQCGDDLSHLHRHSGGQRPFYAPQFQQVRPRWQSNPQQQQQMRASQMPVMPGAAQVPRARGVSQLAPRGMGPQQVQAGGAPAQRMAAVPQGQQTRVGPPVQLQQQARPAFKFAHGVCNQPTAEQAQAEKHNN